MANRIVRPLSEIAAESTFRTIDGVAIRFVESDRRDTGALLLGPWPESVFAYEPAWWTDGFKACNWSAKAFDTADHVRVVIHNYR